jgi:rhamnose utilization protein RhaD (predicted bifunctional aldolase and dehydrogenase)/NAD(P)-dependent dehydrogenase (short-subunit alcohol dehydrogenase family)
MQSFWNDAAAAECKTEIAQRIYTSRLIGREPLLVLPGGGNTSVKVTEADVFGEPTYLLYIKGSGWDLATIDAKGFAPVRIDHMLRLARLPQLSDSQMAQELRIATMRADAPAPSVEAILHAILPYKFVDHCHADALIALMNSRDGEDRIRDLYGDSIVIVPYVMPGFALAKLCAELFPSRVREHTRGIVLLNHGLFTFGDSAKSSYERTIELVTKAEDYLSKFQDAGKGDILPVSRSSVRDRTTIARLRQEVSRVAGKPMILVTHRDDKALHFAQRPDLPKIALQGPATPDHVIRTKRIPMIGRDVDSFTLDYRLYFARNAARVSGALTMLDPAPRVILDSQLGMVAVGADAWEAGVTGDIYRHTIDMILAATALGGWRSISEEDVFDVEYWELEQAKLGKTVSAKPFRGEIALVTGAASGIGKACVEAFMSRGAAVVGLDLSISVESQFVGRDYLGIRCDITDESALQSAFDLVAERFGGLDILVLNAGIFPPSRRLADLDLKTWSRTMSVNLDANVSLLRFSHELLRLAPGGGRVVVNASKNVPAPGAGQAAYSASKAALTQLARVAALEWGADRIRVNTVHPNAVFDTGIWTNEVLEQRAASYGISVQEYKTNNILRTEITSRDVGEVIAELCGPCFSKTTGAQVPIDGGNERVI